MGKVKVIEINENIGAANETAAGRIREQMTSSETLFIPRIFSTFSAGSFLSSSAL